MPDTDTDYGFPYIPLSRLRELKHHAELVVAAIAGGAFTGSDLWRIVVALEVNSVMANHWYSQLDNARNYNSFSAEGCPLCVYDNGRFVASCNFHKEIDSLREELARYAQEIESLKKSGDSRTGTESEGNSD